MKINKDEEVAPYVGAWIETNEDLDDFYENEVAPYVGAWIETRRHGGCQLSQGCRTLCGCVD